MYFVSIEKQQTLHLVQQMCKEIRSSLRSIWEMHWKTKFNRILVVYYDNSPSIPSFNYFVHISYPQDAMILNIYFEPMAAIYSEHEV